MNKTLVLSVVVSFAAALAQASHPSDSQVELPQSIGFSLSSQPAEGATASDLQVLVVDEDTGAAVADASVAVGDSLGDDSVDVMGGSTDAQGSLLLHGALARGPRALTVAKDSYAMLSIVGLTSPRITIYLRRLPGADDSILASGQMTGWQGVGANKNIVTAGLVLKSLGALDLLHFNPNDFISPLKDTIEVMGSREIPSNLAIPEQYVSPLFLPIRVSKPNYRLPLMRGRAQRLAGVQGTIAVKDILGAVQGGKMSLALLNKLTFTRAGVTTPLTMDRDVRVDVAATEALSPAHQVSPAAAPFAGGDVIVAAATDLDGARTALVPTDIKMVANRGSVSVRSAPTSFGRLRDVLTVAMADKGRRLSGIISENVGATLSPGGFLPADALSPVMDLPELVTLKSNPSGLAAAVFDLESGASSWTVYALPGSGASVNIPSRKLPANAKIVNYALMSLDFGGGFDAHELDGQRILQSLKRFARSTAHVGPEKGEEE